jgi:hypothetical protein
LNSVKDSKTKAKEEEKNRVKIMAIILNIETAMQIALFHCQKMVKLFL